jgi:ADP-ribose pyrophosphatase YjhB (NUDIX family)
VTYSPRPDATPLKQSAGYIFRDEVGKFLVVEPAYNDTWEIPGGQIESGESPREACEREVDEELGLVVHVGDLRCIDHVRSRDSYRFAFGEADACRDLEDAERPNART